MDLAEPSLTFNAGTICELSLRLISILQIFDRKVVQGYHNFSRNFVAAIKKGTKVTARPAAVMSAFIRSANSNGSDRVVTPMRNKDRQAFRLPICVRQVGSLIGVPDKITRAASGSSEEKLFDIDHRSLEKLPSTNGCLANFPCSRAQIAPFRAARLVLWAFLPNLSRSFPGEGGPPDLDPTKPDVWRFPYQRGESFPVLEGTGNAQLLATQCSLKMESTARLMMRSRAIRPRLEVPRRLCL